MAKNRMPYPHCRWNERMVSEVREQVKRELDDVSSKEGHRARLSHAMQGIAELESSDSARGQLRRYVLVISVLVAHERNGGLTPAQVNRLEALALAILKTQGVRPQQSRLAGLYSDLDLVISQIRRKSGAHWDALWLQQIAAQFSSREAPSSHGHLALAIRAQREGFIDSALQNYEAAIRGGLSGSQLYRAHWGKITTLRLAGQLEEARHAIRETEKLEGLEPIERTELEWQSKCIETQSTGNPMPLVTAVARGKIHFQVEYRIEAALWAYAVSSKEPLSRLPLLRSLPRIHRASVKDDRLYCVALGLENCYDTAVPLSVRARALGKLIERAHRLLHLDHELLVLVAAARWLARVHLFTLSDFCLQLYRRISLSLSGSRTADVLNVASDLMEKAESEAKAA
jgi:hypothetical protein